MASVIKWLKIDQVQPAKQNMDKNSSNPAYGPLIYCRNHLKTPYQIDEHRTMTSLIFLYSGFFLLPDVMHLTSFWRIIFQGLIEHLSLTFRVILRSAYIFYVDKNDFISSILVI